MSSAPTKPRTKRGATIEHEITEVRELALRRDGRMVERAAQLERDVQTLAARAELVTALVAADTDGAGARPRLEAAVDAVHDVATEDPQVLLDVALALVILDRPTQAFDSVLRGIEAGAAELVTPAQVLAFVDRLIGPGPERNPVVEPVLRMLYEQFISRPDRTLARAEGGARRAPVKRRRFLHDALHLVDQRIARRPPDQTLLVIRAAILFGLGRLKDAQSTAERALTERPDDPLARALLVDILARRRAYDSAVEEFQRLPSDRLDSGRAALEQVHLLVHKGDPDQAAKIAERALERGRGGVELEVAYAEALVAAERWDDAERHIEALAAEHDDRADVLVLRAELEERRGDKEAAILTLRMATERSDDDPVPHLALARLLEETGRFEECLRHLDRAIEADPGRLDVIVWRARVLLHVGRAVEALDTMQRVDVGDSDEAHGVRADILSALGRDEEALDWYVRAFERAERGSPARARYVQRIEAVADELLAVPRPAEALGAIERVREAGDELSVDALALRAELLRLQGRPRAALEQVDDVADKGFDGVWVAGTKGQTLVDLGRSAEALPLVEDALQRDPGYAFGASVLVTALDALDRPGAALRELEARFETAGPPAGWETWTVMARAQLLLRLARYAEAIEGLQQPLSEHPHEPDWLGPLGYAQNRCGNPEAAIDALQFVVGVVGTETRQWVYIELADALEMAGKPDQARLLWERVVRDPSGMPGAEPPTPSERFERGWCLLQLGEPSAALAEYDQGLQEATDPVAESRALRAAALWLTGRREEARTALREVLDGVRATGDADWIAAVHAEVQYLLARLDDVDALSDEIRERQEAT